MGFLGYLTIALSIIWAVPEFRNIIQKRSGKSAAMDRSSLLVVLATTYASIALAVVIKVVPGMVGSAGRIAALPPFVGYFGCLVMVAGMIVRWAAVATLRKQFTVDVSIVEGHEVIEKGLYRLIRHPAYAGTLLTLLGLGLALENWLSLLLLFALPFAGTLYRISIEEKVLLDHFGSVYAEYMKRTKRLIPGVL